MKDTIYWVLVILGIMMIAVGFIGGLIISQLDSDTKRVDCYDRFGHKINGLDCEKKVTSDIVTLLILTGVLGFGIILLALVSELFKPLPNYGSYY